MSDSEEVFGNDDVISNEFNKYFTEVGQQLKNKIQPTHKDHTKNLGEFLGEKMTLNETNANEIEEIICGLKNVGAGIEQHKCKPYVNVPT